MTVHTVLDLSGQALEDIFITLAGGGAPTTVLGKASIALELLLRFRFRSRSLSHGDGCAPWASGYFLSLI